MAYINPRCKQILDATPEERYRIRLRSSYKFYRRRGRDRIQALEEAKQRVARLSGMVTMMEASDWKLDPIKVAHDITIASQKRT